MRLFVFGPVARELPGAAIEIDLRPLHTGDFVTPLSSQHQDAHDVAMYVYVDAAVPVGGVPHRDQLGHGQGALPGRDRAGWFDPVGRDVGDLVVVVRPVEQHLQDRERLVGMRVVALVEDGIQDVADILLGDVGDGFVFPVLEALAGDTPSHFDDGARSRFRPLSGPVALEEFVTHIGEAVGGSLDLLVARGRVQHLLRVLSVSGGGDDGLRAIPRRLQIEAFGIGGHGFLVLPDRVAAFFPLAALENAGHHNEGLAAAPGDPNAEPRGDGVPEILLHLVRFQVLNRRRSDPFSWHCGGRGGWFLEKNRYHRYQIWPVLKGD